VPPPRHPSSPLTFTANPIDRAALSRADEKQTRSLLTSGKARIVPVWNQRHLISAEWRALIFTFDQVAHFIDLEASTLVFLGLDKGEPWFALGLPDSDLPPKMSAPGDFVVLNDVVTLLPASEATVLAYARAMVIWHFNHLYCGRCGANTIVSESGHSRICRGSNCAYRSFPRTDPAVIALVSDGPRCLLGRQAQWPAGMYSTIAGFVEPGETLEQTVRREVREETGIEIGEVKYLASQPWPFPSSIMLGFRAEALSSEINLDDDELEDCRWFTRTEISSFGDRDAAGLGFKLPGRYSIARFLIEEWVQEV
jgi:NAD+ diphosphatase